MEIEVRDGSKTLTPEVLDPGAGWWLSWKVRGPLGESQIQMATGNSRNDDPASLRPMSKKNILDWSTTGEPLLVQSTSIPYLGDFDGVWCQPGASDG